MNYRYLVLAKNNRGNNANNTTNNQNQDNTVHCEDNIIKIHAEDNITSSYPIWGVDDEYNLKNKRDPQDVREVFKIGNTMPNIKLDDLSKNLLNNNIFNIINKPKNESNNNTKNTDTNSPKFDSTNNTLPQNRIKYVNPKISKYIR